MTQSFDLNLLKGECNMGNIITVGELVTKLQTLDQDKVIYVLKHDCVFGEYLEVIDVDEMDNSKPWHEDGYIIY